MTLNYHTLFRKKKLQKSIWEHLTKRSYFWIKQKNLDGEKDQHSFLWLNLMDRKNIPFNK